MRRNTSIHYATAVTQYERHPNGQQWANPEFCLASHGNVGCSIANVQHIDHENYPFGEYGSTQTVDGLVDDYKWQPDDKSTLSHYHGDANEHHRKPHSLRFSGFTIDDVGITSNCIVTNLYIHIEYTDDTVQHYGPALQPYKMNGSNWLIKVYKAGNIPGGILVGRKRFDGVSTTSPYVSVETIPMMRDQSWGTNTYGHDIMSNYLHQGQRNKPAESTWYDNNDISEINVLSNTKHSSIGYTRQEYYEHTERILHQATPLTIADVNDPGFHIDLWYGKFFNFSGVVKIKSIGISVEYIQPFMTSANLYPIGSGGGRPKTIYRGDRQSQGWVNPHFSSSLDTKDLYPDDYCYINLYSKYLGQNYKPFTSFDSDILLGRLPAIANLDDTVEISDMILNFRVRNLHDDIPVLWFGGNDLSLNRRLANYLGIKYTYYLYDGYPTDSEGSSSYGTPVWKNSLQLFEPGMKRDYNLSGQDWLYVNGGWNNYCRDFYGSDFYYPNYSTFRDYFNWHNRHYPIRRYDSNYTVESMNSSYYPGMVYDPFWIEKALKAGELFIGLSVTTNFRSAPYYQSLKYYWNHLRWRHKLKGFGVRVKYSYVVSGPPLPTGVSGPTPNYSLLVRHT